jgi:hypothetical protein
MSKISCSVIALLLIAAGVPSSAQQKLSVLPARVAKAAARRANRHNLRRPVESR